MRNKLILPLLACLVFLSSCELVGGIFKAGMGFGIFIVVFIIAIIVILVMRSGKK